MDNYLSAGSSKGPHGPSWVLLMFLYIAAIAIVLLFNSCSTSAKINKATGYLENHGRLVLPKGKLDSACAAAFPVAEFQQETTSGVDSSKYLAYIAELKILLKQSQATQDSLINAYLTRPDTACSRYVKAMAALQGRLSQLQEQLSHVPAIRDTSHTDVKTRDRAYESTLEDKIRDYQGQVAELNASLEAQQVKTDIANEQADKWHHEYSKWKLIAIALATILLLLVFKRPLVKLLNLTVPFTGIFPH